MPTYTDLLTNSEIEDAYKKWGLQRGQAIYKRNIEWDLTFDQWITWWLNTGHFSERGVGKGKYCMSRIGDKGGYTLDNIFCQTFVQNFLDGTRGKQGGHHTKWSEEARARRCGAGNPAYGRTKSKK